MKAYKVELLILDFDQLGPEEIKEVIENQKFPNYCINPHVMKVHERDMGEWDDDHPFNNGETIKLEYEKLFTPE